MTVGLDVSDRSIHACFLDHDGQVVEESRLAATTGALRRRFSGGELLRVVLEAGVHSPWMNRLLAELGHEVYVANPPQTESHLREREQERPSGRPSTSLASDALIQPCFILYAIVQLTLRPISRYCAAARRQ